MQLLTSIAFQFVPAKKTSRSGNTKIPRDRRILMRKRRKLLDRYNDPATGHKFRDKAREKLIKIEILLQKSHHDGMKRREQLALKSIKTNPKYFFSYAKKFSKTHTKIGPLLNELNNYTNSSPEMVEILSKLATSK